MIYNILFLKDNNSDVEKAKQLLEDVGQKFSISFAFEKCDLSSSKEELIKKAKSANAVLLDGYMPNLRGLCKELGLYVSVRQIGDITLVSDAFGGIYDSEKGFRNNPTFGREAYDNECYSELEIERVARIAYELNSTRHIMLIDKADELATSKLWRKIVTDVNEDYPFINVDMASMDNAIEALMNNTAPDTLLTSHLFGDIIYSVLSAKADKAKFSAFLGDTTLGMYAITGNAYQTISFMLRHSFDMQAEADYIESL